MLKSSIVGATLSLSTLCGQVYHHTIDKGNANNESYCWEKNGAVNFNELLISWNSKRPAKGYYAIYASVHQSGSWSEWMHYADWGADGQKGDASNPESGVAKVYQDAVEVLNGEVGDGFKIKIVANGGANLANVHALHVNACVVDSIASKQFDETTKSSFINVRGISQMALPTPNNNRLCSPTATSAIVNFLNGNDKLDPIEFANRSWDGHFDIFGNWVFNVAEAYNQLNDTKYACWVERLDSFQGVIDSLERGFPVVISIRGPLAGSALPYESGHLIAVIGYDHESKMVSCMDPAFNTDSETIVKYELNDLIEAWARRKNVAYVFTEASQLQLSN